MSGSLQGAGTIGGLLAAIGGPSSEVAFYAYDANGNVSAVMSLGSGGPSTISHYSYDPFGNLLPGLSPVPSSFLFSTKYLDSETGLYYYGYRHYSPSRGRWLSRDPLEEAGGRNLYGFVGNDGISGIDYFGLEGIWSGIGGCIGAGVNLVGGAVGTVVGAPGRMLGEVTSVVTLEKFQARGRSPVDPAQIGQCGFLLTLSGMGNASEENRNFGEEIMDAFPKMQSFIGRRYWGYANNPALLSGLASEGHALTAVPGIVQSILKLPADELGGARVPSVATADYLQEAYAKAKANGCCNIDILVVAHSQGGRVLANAIRYLSGDVKKTMRILTLNAEYAFPDNGEYAWVRNFKQKGFDIASSTTAWQPARWFGRVKVEEIAGVTVHDRAAFMNVIGRLVPDFVPER